MDNVVGEIATRLRLPKTIPREENRRTVAVIAIADGRLTRNLAAAAVVGDISGIRLREHQTVRFGFPVE